MNMHRINLLLCALFVILFPEARTQCSSAEVEDGCDLYVDPGSISCLSRCTNVNCTCSTFQEAISTAQQLARNCSAVYIHARSGEYSAAGNTNLQVNGVPAICIDCIDDEEEAGVQIHCAESNTSLVDVRLGTFSWNGVHVSGCGHPKLPFISGNASVISFSSSSFISLDGQQIVDMTGSSLLNLTDMVIQNATYSQSGLSLKLSTVVMKRVTVQNNHGFGSFLDTDACYQTVLDNVLLLGNSAFGQEKAVITCANSLSLEGIVANLFVHNMIAEGNHGDGAGVLRVQNLHAVVVNGIFEANSGYGTGAVWISAGPGSTIFIVGSEFNNNTAMHSTGALRVDADVGAPTECNVDIYKCSFQNNSVHRTEGAGGALRISDVSVRVDSSNFTRNFAQFGGAIVLFSELGSYLSPAFPISWNITSCIVEENGEYLSTTSQPWQQSPRSLIGGGILFNNPSRVALEGCKIRHNVARVYGGGIAVIKAGYVFDGGQPGLPFFFTSTRNTVFNNRALVSGGGAYFANVWTSSENDAFYNNSATDFGGGVFVESTIRERALFSLSNASFVHNQAGQAGGAIFCSSGAIEVEFSLLYNNTASVSGGAIQAKGDSLVTMSAVNLDYNRANTGGHGLFTDSTVVYFRHVNVSHGIAGEGGALGFRKYVKGEISYCRIINNSARRGGAIYVSDFVSPNFTNCVIRHNVANSQGGGILVTDSASSRFASCDISFNNGGTNGGGVSLHSSSVPTFHNCSIVANVAGTGGGVDATDNAKPTFTNCYITANHAIIAGGGVSATSAAAPQFYLCSITHNMASSSGGGTYLVAVTNTSFMHCNISFNTGYYRAGGFEIGDDASVDVEFSFIEQNEAPLGGGFVVGGGSQVAIAGSNFTANRGLNKGGDVVTMQSSSINVSATTFSGSRAAAGGSCAFLDHSSGSFINCTFDRTHALEKGGGIKTEDTSRLTIQNCSFVGCNSYDGGGIFLESIVEASITKSSFIHCTSVSSGGGVSCRGESRSTISDCIFHSCFSAFTGGSLATDERCHLQATGIQSYDGFASVGGHAAILGQSSVFMFEALLSSTRNSSVVRSNVTALNGGGIMVDLFAHLYLWNSTIEGTGAGKGGGVYMNSNDSVIAGCTITNCTADKGGGVFLEISRASGYSSRILDTLFFNNRADTGGGGVSFLCTDRAAKACQWSVDKVLSNSTFHGNFGRRGGALYGYGVASASDSVFLNNSALFGGVLYVLNYRKITVDDDGDQLTFHGLPKGRNSSCWLKNCTFDHNGAIGAGGIFFDGPVPSQISVCCCNNAEPLSPNTSCCFGMNTSTSIGYESRTGAATLPIAAHVSSGPTSLFLPTGTQHPTMNISLYLTDFYGNYVHGLLLSNATDYRASVAVGSATCFINDSQTTAVFGTDGRATFTQLSLLGTANTLCPLVISVEAHDQPNHDISPALYNVTLSCPSNTVVVKGDTYDTCSASDGHSGMYWLIGIVVTLIVVLLVALIGLGWLLYRHFRRRGRIRNLYKELGAAHFNLKSVFDDEDIPKIPFDQLVVGARLGSGSTGTVFKAHWRQAADRVLTVAVKQFHCEVQDMTDGELRSLVLEVKVMAKLRHDNVVRLYGITFPSSTALLFVMELCELGSVEKMLRNKTDKPVPWKMRVSWAIDAARGLEYLHKCRLVHRDIKPQNLFLTSSLECKVGDFGCAALQSPTTMQNLTVLGTPLYLSPELYERSECTEKSDVFSFGMTLVAMYTGKVPFDGDPRLEGVSKFDITRSIVRDKLRPIMNNYPPPLAQLVVDCTQYSPRLRPSMREVKTRLKRLKHVIEPDADVSRRFDSEPRDKEGGSLQRRRVQSIQSDSDEIPPASIILGLYESDSSEDSDNDAVFDSSKITLAKQVEAAIAETISTASLPSFAHMTGQEGLPVAMNRDEHFWTSY